MAANRFGRGELFRRFHFQNRQKADEIDSAGDDFKSVDCSQPLYERARKKSRASAKHAGGGGGVCAREKNREQARSTRGGVAIFLDPHPPPSRIFRFALASSSLAMVSARSTKENTRK